MTRGLSPMQAAGAGRNSNLLANSGNKLFASLIDSTCELKSGCLIGRPSTIIISAQVVPAFSLESLIKIS